MDYKEIFRKANAAAELLTLAECGNDVMIYPCGFAWFFLNNGIRGKRNPLGKELEALGLLKYDDYKKNYYHWVGQYNQSVTHKEAHARFVAEMLTEQIGEKFSYDSKWD